MSDCCVYCIKNITNKKVYVGQTVNFENRKRKHVHQLRNKCNDNKRLQQEFNNLGKHFFLFEVLEYTEECELDQKEKDWITKLNATNPDFGYNLKAGGHRCHRQSPETRKKMSLANKGKIFTAEHRIQMSRSQRKRLLTAEECEKIKIKTAYEKEEKLRARANRLILLDKLAKAGVKLNPSDLRPV